MAKIRMFGKEVAQERLAFPMPVEVREPVQKHIPLIIDSPHSGRAYQDGFQTTISRRLLRQAEDCYVDQLCENAPAYGARFLRALFPRTYVDPNRDRNDIDPLLVGGPNFPQGVSGQMSRMGLGVVHRLLANQPIYSSPLGQLEILRRIETCWVPYHLALKRLYDQVYRQFGVVYHLNMHSMPSSAAAQAGLAPHELVLGDLEGQTSSRKYRDLVADILIQLGYRVRFNQPYRGNWIIQSNSNPRKNRHALQIEINRGLYLDEALFQKNANFYEIRTHMETLFERLRENLPSGVAQI